MIGPAPLCGGRKSSPVGRSGTQEVIVSGARLRIDAAGSSLVLPSSRKLFCACALVIRAAAAQQRPAVKYPFENMDIQVLPWSEPSPPCAVGVCPEDRIPSLIKYADKHNRPLKAGRRGDRCSPHGRGGVNGFGAKETPPLPKNQGNISRKTPWEARRSGLSTGGIRFGRPQRSGVALLHA
jgi:hypothetical protein